MKLKKVKRDTMLKALMKGQGDAMLKPLIKVKRVQKVLTPWFLIIIGEEECGNNFEEDETFPLVVIRLEDMTDQKVMGFNDNDVLDRVNNIDQMVRDVEFQSVYTTSELARQVVRSTLAFLEISNFCSLRQVMVGLTKVSNNYWIC